MNKDELEELQDIYQMIANCGINPDRIVVTQEKKPERDMDMFYIGIEPDDGDNNAEPEILSVVYSSPLSKPANYVLDDVTDIMTMSFSLIPDLIQIVLDTDKSNLDVESYRMSISHLILAPYKSAFDLIPDDKKEEYKSIWNPFLSGLGVKDVFLSSDFDDFVSDEISFDGDEDMSNDY